MHFAFFDVNGSEVACIGDENALRLNQLCNWIADQDAPGMQIYTDIWDAADLQAAYEWRTGNAVPGQSLGQYIDEELNRSAF